ncbi:MAG TPA: hypothetical protein VJ872_06635 [Nocardioides sp.]|nr:hypothetical protein [Nocardioides sp.]
MTDDNAPDPALARRREAEGAAADLARMGIDPRSLGLGPTPQPAPVAPAPDAGSGGEVVQFRRRDPLPDDPTILRPRPVEQVPPPPPPVAAAPAPAPPLAPPPPPAPRDLPRLLQRAAVGVVSPESAAGMQGERALVDRIRQRQTNRRVVAFASTKGGVGCTSVAVGVGAVLTALRDDRSAVVDVQQGGPSLGALLGAERPRSCIQLLAQDDAVDPPRGRTGLSVVDGSGWDLALRRIDVSDVLDRLGRDHTFNLLDVGNDAGEGSHTALARADRVVLVSTAGVVGEAALQAAFDRLRRVNPMAASGAVAVVVATSEPAYKQAVRDLRGRPQVVVVPPDPWLAAGSPFEPGVVRAETREAMLRIAAAVVDGGGRA